MESFPTYQSLRRTALRIKSQYFPPIPRTLDEFTDIPEQYQACDGDPCILLFERYLRNI